MVTVICGHSGSGKTHKRTTNAELSKLPVVDMMDIVEKADSIKDDKFEFMMDLLAKGIKQHGCECVVEGHFFEGAPSTDWLKSWLSSNDIESNWIRISCDIGLCISRLMSDMSSGGRRPMDRIAALNRDVAKYGI
jgi:hypothetical protein